MNLFLPITVSREEGIVKISKDSKEDEVQKSFSSLADSSAEEVGVGSSSGLIEVGVIKVVGLEIKGVMELLYCNKYEEALGCSSPILWWMLQGNFSSRMLMSPYLGQFFLLSTVQNNK